MRKAKDVKEGVLSCIADILDERLTACGFERSKRSFLYKRKINDTRQVLSFEPDCSSSSFEVRIMPFCRIGFPALKLMAQEVFLERFDEIDSSPDIVIRATLGSSVQGSDVWPATGDDEIRAQLSEINEEYLPGFIEDMERASTVEGLIQIVEQRHHYMMPSRDKHIYAILAYEKLGLHDKAKEYFMSYYGTSFRENELGQLKDHLEREK